MIMNQCRHIKWAGFVFGCWECVKSGVCVTTVAFSQGSVAVPHRFALHGNVQQLRSLRPKSQRQQPGQPFRTFKGLSLFTHPCFQHLKWWKGFCCHGFTLTIFLNLSHENLVGRDDFAIISRSAWRFTVPEKRNYIFLSTLNLEPGFNRNNNCGLRWDGVFAFLNSKSEKLTRCQSNSSDLVKQQHRKWCRCRLSSWI